MVMVREYMACFYLTITEKDVKEAVKCVGGVYNMSGLFLATTSEALIVTKKTIIH